MTNKDKYENYFLAEMILNTDTSEELKEKGLILGQDSRKWNEEVCKWLEQEYKLSKIKEYRQCISCKYYFYEDDCEVCKNCGISHANWEKEESDKPMRELKVGDRVRVRSGMGLTWSDDMLEFCDTIQVVGTIDEEDGVYLEWHEEWVFEREDLTLIEDEEYQSCDNCKHEYKESSKYPCCNCSHSDGVEDLWNTDKSKNYIAEFMKDNGLEIGEEFKVDGIICRFIDSYFLYSDGESVKRTRALLIKLLKGELKPIKLEPQVDWDRMVGEYIEVSQDGSFWHKRKYLGIFHGFHMFESESDATHEYQPVACKYARQIKE